MAVNLANGQNIHNSNTPIVCQSCEARHKGVCGALSPEQLTRLSKHTTIHAVEREIQLQTAEDSQTTYSNILSGVVKLSKLMSDGRQQIVGLKFAPDFMGRPFTNESDVTLEAATNVRLCTFPKSALEDMLLEAPEMEHRLHQQTLKELNEARDWLLALGRKTAAEKVASFILMIASHIDPESDRSTNVRVIELPMRRSDIADFLGLTTETVSRQLTNLRKRGIVQIEDRRVLTINSMSALTSASEKLA